MANFGTGTSRRLAITTAAATMALALLAAACGGGTATTGSSAPSGTEKLNEKDTPLEAADPPVLGGKLVVAVPGESNGWNPHVNQWADAGSFEGPSMIEPLAIVDPNGDAKPWLLDTWTPNADFTQWDLTVHPGIAFHNGEKLDGKALAETLTFSYTKGLTSIALGPVFDHVEATGPLTAKVFLKVKWAQFPSSLSSQWGMAPAMLESADFGVVKPVGTGPFVFDEWKQGEYLRAKKNPNYWRKDAAGRQLPYLDSIEFRPIVDDSSKQKALEAGDIDMTLTTQAAMATQMDGDYTVLRDYTSERTMVMLNTADDPQHPDNPFTNLHARKALAYATDRNSIAADIDERVQVTTQGYRPDSKWGLPEDQTGYPAYDVEKAKAEVEAYKKDTGRSDFTFTLTGLTNPDDVRIMQQLEGQWQQAGITAKIDSVDQTKYISLIALGYFQAGWFRWYGYANPDNNYVYNASETSHPAPGISINFTHYTSATMDKNLHLGRESTDEAVRKQANAAVIKETNEAAINIWLFDTPYSIIANKKVRGLNAFRINPFGNFSPKAWWGDVWIQH